jgi:hypothetical protein
MLRAFPFRTFEEIAALGPRCLCLLPELLLERGPIDLTDVRLRGGSFTGARVVCAVDRSYGSAVPSRVCGH